jgi:hypothetical protein
MTVPAAFTLWKSTSPSNRAEYIGHVTLPDGRMYAVEANVVAHDKGDGTAGKGKHFEGRVYSVETQREKARDILRGAKIEGTLPADLVSLMQAEPDLDDSAEFIAGTKKTGSP